MRNNIIPSDLSNIHDEKKFLLDLSKSIDGICKEYISGKSELMNRCQHLQSEQADKNRVRLEQTNSQSKVRQAALKRSYDEQVAVIRNAFETESAEIKQVAADARSDYDSLVRSNTESLHRFELLNQTEKNYADSCLRVITACENSIRCPAYDKIISNPQKADLQQYASFAEIMELPLQAAADRIKFINSGALQRLAAGGELKQLYAILASARVSATRLYANITAADERLRNLRNKTQLEMQRLGQSSQETINRANEALKPLEKRYQSDLADAKIEYDDRLAAELIRLKKETVETERINADETTSLNSKVTALQTEFKESFFKHFLSEFPPNIIKIIIDRIADQNRCKVDWKPNQNYPNNITLGKLECSLQDVLANGELDSFISKNYSFIYENGKLIFPFSVPFNEQYSMYLSSPQGENPNIESDLREICLSAFLSAPPGKLRFSFIDPVKSGKTFSVFQLFEDDAEHANKIILNGTMTESSMIEKQLRLISDQITNMNEKVFKGLYEGCSNKLAKYNEDNPHTSRPYTLLAISDFPAHFSENAITLLEKIVATGGSCGIYTVISESAIQMQAVDAKVKSAASRLRTMLWQYTWSQQTGSYTMTSPSGTHIANSEIRFDQPLNASEIKALSAHVIEEIKNAGRVTVDYEYMMKPPSEWSKKSSLYGLMIPLGLQGSGNIQYLSLGQDRSSAVHGLVVGQTGSGKTGLLHAVIMGALLEYPADELEIYLVDYKSGVEFKIYTNYELPSFRVVAIESEQEFGISVLDYVMKEADRRAKLFKSNSVNNITAYREHTGQKMPRILLIIDEFHELFNEENSVLARSASSKVDTILKLYRSFGIHVLLSTQSLKGFHGISDGALAQIAVRIALKCPADDARTVLGASAPLMNQIERDDAGSAVYSASNGDDINASMLFRTAYLTVDKIDEILCRLSQQCKNMRVNTRVLISDIENSRNNPLQHFAKTGENLAEEFSIHLGEPLKLESQMALRFRMAPNNNLLLVGDNQQKAQDMLYYITLGALLQRDLNKGAHQKDRVVVFNFNDDGESDESDINDRLRELSLSFPSIIDYAIADNAQDTLQYIEEIYAWNRDAIRDGREEDVCRVWVVMSNMRLCSVFQKDSIYDKPEYSRLMQLYADGPKNGIFMISWADSLSLITGKYPDMLRYCDYRIVFNMSGDDMMTLAGVENDSTINRNNAILFRQNKQNQKFRPYVTASREWFTKIAHQIERILEAK